MTAYFSADASFFRERENDETKKRFLDVSFTSTQRFLIYLMIDVNVRNDWSSPVERIDWHADVKRYIARNKDEKRKEFREREDCHRHQFLVS